MFHSRRMGEETSSIGSHRYVEGNRERIVGAELLHSGLPGAAQWVIRCNDCGTAEWNVTSWSNWTGSASNFTVDNGLWSGLGSLIWSL